MRGFFLAAVAAMLFSATAATAEARGRRGGDCPNCNANAQAQTTTTTTTTDSGGSSGGAYTGGSAGGSGGEHRHLFGRRRNKSAGGSSGGEGASGGSSGGYGAAGSTGGYGGGFSPDSLKHRSTGCGCCDKCTGEAGCNCGCAKCTCSDRPARTGDIWDRPDGMKGTDRDRDTRSPGPPRERSSDSNRGAQLSPAEQQFLQAVNDARLRAGKSPYVADPLLTQIARERVPFVTARYANQPMLNGWNHRARGCWVWEDAKRHGFPGFATDNLAMGQSQASEAVQGWMNEHGFGHDKQLLGYSKLNGQWVDRHFNCCGVAQQGNNYIAIFGSRG